MPSGGARATSGPAPDPTALRRNRKSDAAGWRTLPAEGRTGPTPEFPLEDVQPREWDLWRDLWTRPQAIMWEENGLHFEVALFARTLARAEGDKPRTEDAKLTRQYLESLGLTAPGMARLRWKIAPADHHEAEETAAGTATKPTARKSARDRLKVVRDGEGS
ncbi:hypothetical protein J4H86_21200 [Spiractinospora alimapuensis]|uniref:phage terminase small subunit n=1 Tax=Spiractinospora alimapuensis TaxID=2820884 RepID=UPI001F2A6BD9|nr:hypothetical protein [Spiractinospora alimapuensis]QVQ51308.1 hypothetical protein J4H86_21200 [Spiractinospora alimapuensis]